MEKSKTALENYIDLVRRELGENALRICSPQNALSEERSQMHNMYIAGMDNEKDLTIRTTSQHALDYIYKIYGK